MKRLCCFLALSLIATATGWIAPLEAAQAGDPIIHLVQPGENLFRISLRYGVPMDSVMAANGLTNSHTIYAGQQLVIPVASDSTAAAEGQPTMTGNVYTVLPGDTLTSVALYHGVTIWMLVQANELSNPHIIYAGQQLVIPAHQAAMAAQDRAAPEPNQTAEDAAPGELTGTYTVRPGDTLYRIAQQFGTTVAKLAYLNGITNPSTIYGGQVLYLGGEMPTTVDGAKRIVVDLSEQHLYAYQEAELIYSFVASSGAAPTYTRTGEFRVQSKIPNAYGATWNIWMPHWLGIYWAGGSENGIHALPILPSGQTLWAGYLGTPISYGCIVLGTYEAKLLYDWAEIGTPVTIQP